MLSLAEEVDGERAVARTDLRVAIAHEWLTRYAGSERCVEEMLFAFPGARVLTTLIDRARMPEVFRAASPSWLQRLPLATSHHEWLIPVMPIAWRLRRPLSDVDIVISSSHACAKAVRRAPGIPHLCYCHTPMRYAWDFASEASRFPPALRLVARTTMAGFRRWDRTTAGRVTRFVANSRAVARRIETCYGREATVIHPPVDTEFFRPGGTRGDDFLYVGRLVGYKRPDLVIEAFRELPHRLHVVGVGQLQGRLQATAPPNVVFLGEVSRHRLRGLFRSARALVYPINEDFGITMAEAQACGTPVVGLEEGGAADIVADGETGWLLRTQDVRELRRAIRLVARAGFEEATITNRAQRFSAARFRQELGDAAQQTVSEARRGGSSE
jgi:glycosyltransferase involved in cell wall biosynthesis